jgi:gliding motility-associated-like protein
VYPDSINEEYYSYLFCEDVGVWEFDPLPDTLLLCPGESKILNASFLEASYTWSDGSTDSTLSISREGIYRVSANLGECILSDSVVVIRIEEQAHSPTDTLICQGEKITLSAPFPGTYEWSTGATSSKIEIVGSGMYTLTITNECGDFTYDSHVETEVCDCPIYVPNVFSPDGDGVNDELLVFAVCDFPFSIKRFQVFDRWGSLVYTSVSEAVEDIRWDGLVQGKKVASGVYTWCMEYIVATKGQPDQKTLQGDITILR